MRDPVDRASRDPGTFQLRNWVLGVVSLWILQGCAAVALHPPEGPKDPVTVALLDHGHHSSLVLPAKAAGAWVRYSYGDWAFYVERRMNPLMGFAGLFLPTKGALGRQVLTGPGLAGVAEQQLRVPLEESFPLVVTRERATALREELEDIWHAGYDERAESRAWDMTFAEHPEAYTLLNNSNRMVANWLMALEIEVSRVPLLSNWQVGSP
ncbi:hypothetical protein [Thioalkalivibrio sp.]|uniref:hypothetical protein n=1 Tax=Thioalkalivibrio sp. TaxID=2093813 RepID=UPI003569FAC3